MESSIPKSADLVVARNTRKPRSHLRQKPIAPKAEFIEAFQSDSICPVLLEKIFHFARRANQLYKPAPSCLTRGAARDRHGRRERDAVDASCATDESGSCGRRSRVVLTPRCWRELATMLCIARGMPGVSGVTVVTNLRVFYFYTQGCGRIERPAFPAPSMGESFIAGLGRITRRGGERVSVVGCLTS